MQTTKNLIPLTLKALNCTQKELAAILKVSPTQISKWKNGGYMSPSMELKIKEKLDIGDNHPELILLAGSTEAATKWSRLFHFLREYALDVSDTCYDTDFLESCEDEPLLNLTTFQALQDMGVNIPKVFPKELDINYDEIDLSDETESLLNNLLSNPYADLVLSIYSAYISVYSFYCAYIKDDLIELNDDSALLYDIEPRLIELAASKVTNIDPTLAPSFTKFKADTNRKYTQALSAFKIQMIKARSPLLEEPLHLVHRSHEELELLAEREALGLNENRIHPDIYMNELLTGMRALQRDLSGILKKLGLDDAPQMDSPTTNQN